MPGRRILPAGANVGPTNKPVVKTEFRSLKDSGGSLALTSADTTAIERQTATHYSDSERRVITRSDLAALADGKLVIVERYDQLGRTRLRQQIENKDSECPTNDNCPETSGIKVQTRYRTSGSDNFILVSNPFRAATSNTAGTETTMGWTRTVRDRGGRVTETQTYSGAALPFPWGSSSSTTGAVFTTYDQTLTVVTDQNSRTRRAETDGLGRLTSVTENPFSAFGDPAYTTTYLYNAQDNLTNVTQGAQTRSFVYDSLSRLSSATNPESGTVSYSSYDGNGNLLTKSDARGITTTMTYDAMNRIRTRSYNDGTPAVTFVYDEVHVAGSKAKGRLTTVTSTESSYKYEKYDELGRVTRSTQTTAGTPYLMQFGYNLAGGQTSVTYPSNRTVTSTFDATNAGRLSAIAGYASGIQYAVHNALRQITLSGSATANNLVQTTSYNSRLQPTSIVVTKPSTSEQHVNLSYGYYANGNVSSHGIAGGGLSQSQEFTYDAFNRLKVAIENRPSGAPLDCPVASSWCEKYGYDQYGNRWANPVASAAPAITPQVQSAFNANNNRIVGSAYDPAGNQTGAGDGTFTYDAENRQTSVTPNLFGIDPAPNTSRYYYDGEGRRVKRQAYGSTGTYVYDASGRLLAEYRNALWWKDFVYADGRLLAMEDSADRSYITADHLGSTRLVTNSSGNVESRHDYLPFGKEVPDIGSRSPAIGYTSHQNPAQQNILQRFTGKEVDPESGLQYFGARYYSGRQGRFTSPDLPFADQHPEDPQSWNLFTYGRNNPLRYVDPTGLYCVQKDDGSYEDVGTEGQSCAASLQPQEFIVRDNGLFMTGEHGGISFVLLENGGRIPVERGLVDSSGDLMLFAGLGRAVLGGLVRSTAPAAVPTFGGSTPTEILQNVTNTVNVRLATNPELAKTVLKEAELRAAQNTPALPRFCP